MKTIRNMLDDIVPHIYNPNLMQRKVMDAVKNISDGQDYEIVDPNNPVVFAIESSVMTAYASIEHQERCLRKTYPAMATDYNELYPHMSDKDFIDPFAQPAPCTFKLLVGREEVRNYAVPRDDLGVRKLIIPRDSEFMIGGYTFTTQYAIEIRQMPHGGLQVVYDTSIPSPLRILESNTLNWDLVSVPFDGQTIEMIQIDIPTMQYKIDTYIDSIIPATGFRKQYRFNDQFYFARVFLRDGSTWNELPTTHSEVVIDPLNPMAQLKVSGQDIEVYIPDVYIRSGLASGEVRIDVYNTKGAIDIDLRNYNMSEFSMRYRDIGSEVPSTYYAPLKTFSHISMFSVDTVNAGRRGLSFLELRDRVIDNAVGAQKEPISEKQLNSALTDMGYTVTKSIDFVTERIYLASIEMPESTIPELSTPIGSMNGKLTTSFAELTSLDTVHDNGARITITPKTMYKYNDGLVTLDSNSYDDYLLFDPATRSRIINADKFLYTPFHYVLDNNSDILDFRPYYLGQPEITSRQFVENNTTLLAEAAIGSYSFEKTDKGYQLIVVTRSNDVYQELEDDDCFVQISFTPRGYSSDYARLDGEYVGRKDKERVFRFDIGTNLDIDRNDDMIVNNFILVGDRPTDIAMPLDVDMNCIFGVTNYTTSEYRPINADKIIVHEDRTAKAVTHEIMRFKLGTSLPALWSNAKTITSSINYKRYEEDVMAYWEKDVFNRDPDTGTILYEIVDGDIVFDKKHSKGDPVLDVNGDHVVKHAQGDVVIGHDGNPLIDKPRQLQRLLELFLLDGKYLFSNTNDTQRYNDRVISSLLNYATDDIPGVGASLLEKTSLFLYPKTNFGNIDVKLGDGTTAKWDAENRFKVYYYLTASQRQNGDLLNTLAKTTRDVLVEALTKKTISTTDILAEIKDRMGSEIVGVSMDAMGPDADVKLVSILDSSTKPTLGKKLVLNPDSTLALKDDISIGYGRHDPSDDA